jgi:RHS repeat-associated protein
MFPTECAENIGNPFKFSGQFFDDEIGQYYLRARQYDPNIGRFTSRDPVDGKFEEPLTLHKYLYCTNNPINKIDPTGLWSPDIHEQIINDAFSNRFSTKGMRFIREGSEYADTFQGIEDSYIHAMRAGRSNENVQSVEEARKLMQVFINLHLFAYECFRSYGSSAYREFALFNLGMAMHPIMDSTSPAHENFAIWRGRKIDWVTHYAAEPGSISSEQLQRTSTLMRDETASFEKNYRPDKWLDGDWMGF